MNEKKHRKIAMIHQPHFLPWPPYFIRMLSSDVVILLDNVKFHKNYYHNRTKLIDNYGKEFWFTIPIVHSTRNGTIKNVKIDKHINSEKIFRTINMRCIYLKNNVFDIKYIKKIFDEFDNLCELNIKLIEYIITIICDSTNIRKPEIVKCSDIISNSNIDRTERLILLCKKYGCNGIVMGLDSIKCHNIELLLNNNILVFNANNFDDYYKKEVSIIKYLAEDKEYNISQIIKFINEEKCRFRSDL